MERGEKMQAAHRYVDILSDAGFKAVFGDRRNEDVLKDLLNVLLPSHRKVSSLEYMTTELPQFSPFSKSVRLDLRCKGDDGTVFIVEAQCYRQKNFFRRCVLYASKAYDYGSERGDRGEYGLAPVYFIGLLGGEIHELQRGLEEKFKLVREYTFREKESGEVPEEGTDPARPFHRHLPRRPPAQVWRVLDGRYRFPAGGTAGMDGQAGFLRVHVGRKAARLVFLHTELLHPRTQGELPSRSLAERDGGVLGARELRHRLFRAPAAVQESGRKRPRGRQALRRHAQGRAGPHPYRMVRECVQAVRSRTVPHADFRSRLPED